MENIIIAPINSIMGKKAVMIVLRNEDEGVNSLRSPSFLNQSNETKVPELDPILSMGSNMLERICGNFIP